MSRPSGPRIRTVKPERWSDERFEGLGDAEWRLYDGLITRADDEGRQSAHPRLVRADVYPLEERSLEEIRELLHRLHDCGVIRLYAAGDRDLLVLTSWADDQRIDKPTESKLPPPPGGSSEIPREESESAREESCSRARAQDRDQDHDQDQELSSRETREREDITRICNLLAELIHGNDPKAKVSPSSKRWRDAARLLIDRDGRAPEEIEHVMRWALGDPFWRSNVLSMPKLREKFDQLALKAAGGNRTHAPNLGNTEPCPNGTADSGAVTRWAEAQARLKVDVAPEYYDIWLAPLHAHRLDGDTLVLGIPSHLRTWTAERFARVIEAAAGQVQIVGCSGKPS